MRLPCLLLVGAMAAACGSSTAEPSGLPPATDGGGGWGDLFDTGAAAGPDGAGAMDVSSKSDAGGVDSVAADAGSKDGGAVDSGALDAGVLDAGAQDTGAPPVDAGYQPTCGDGACEQPEDDVSCPADCGPPADPCGNGQCDNNESASSCAIDCKPEAKVIWQCLKVKCGAEVSACLPSPACSTGVNSAMNCFAGCNFKSPCNNLSTCVAVFAANPAGDKLAKCGLTECYQGAGSAICGDGVCQTGEDKNNCPSDCVANPICGDGKCDAPETAQSCPIDCKDGPVCGDGKCEAPETAQTCGVDCATKAFCGDKKCTGNETATSCPGDCAVPIKCGDEVCNGSETSANCPIDCASGAKAAWDCLQQKCAAAKGSCLADPSCLSALNEVGMCVCACSGDKKCEEACVLKHLSNTKLVNLGSCGLKECPAGGC